MIGPYVCVGCCSQLSFLCGFGNRSYVSGLLIGSRAVALMGLRTRYGLISGKVDDDPGQPVGRVSGQRVIGHHDAARRSGPAFGAPKGFVAWPESLQEIMQ